MPESRPSSLVLTRKMRKLLLQRNKNRWEIRKIRRSLAKKEE